MSVEVAVLGPPSITDSGYGLCGRKAAFELELELLQERLDMLATAGLPIWATKVKLWAKDNRKRADAYEHALRSLYGHPAVEGIVLWGFWDGEVNAQSTALTTGDDMQVSCGVRASGRLFRYLSVCLCVCLSMQVSCVSLSGSLFRYISVYLCV